MQREPEWTRWRSARFGDDGDDDEDDDYDDDDDDDDDGDSSDESRGGHSGGAGGALATPGILIFQKQVTLFTKSGDTLELEWRHTASKVNKFKPITFPSYLQP